MKKTNVITKLLTFLIVAVLLITVGCNNESNVISDVEALQEEVSFAKFTSTPIDGQYIVVLNNNYSGKSASIQNLKYNDKMAMMKSEIPNNFSKIGISKESIKSTFGYALNGFAVTLSKSQLAELKKDSRIKSIEQDYYVVQKFPVIKAKPPGVGGGPGGNNGQEIPYGITRVGAGQVYTGSNVAWIIDSGIDLTHEDLNVDVARSISYVTGGGGATSPNDQNGHGSHVAGTTAAIDNGVGVIGVAAGASVVAVRVINRRGGGAVSWCVSGVDYVAANAQSGDAANMSLGYPESTAIDNAVINAASLGIKFSLAAGNDGADAATGPSPSPARVNGSNIFTISAMDINDNFASFSNYGEPPVDFCAPGVSVKSTWKGGGYNTISGTSMAAPHVTGLLLWGNVSSNGTVNGDPDGNPDPIAHR